MLIRRMRKNRAPTPLRYVFQWLFRQDLPLPDNSLPQCKLPSHHILCAGTYSPVFARLAAESAMASCPESLRPYLRIYIHVDGVKASQRADLMSWLGEIPGVELTYGLFGIYSGDYIPGKWHQVMVNDVVGNFSSEEHIAFLDADLFLVDSSWWDICQTELQGGADSGDIYSLSVGLRKNHAISLDQKKFSSIRTNLFTLNTRLHKELNQQRYSKDERAGRRLSQEFPSAELTLGTMDSMVCGSLRAQAHGYRVIDVENYVPHCHIGGFSHLKASKFANYQSEARRPFIAGLLGQARFLPRVIQYFDERGWSARVEGEYRLRVNEMLHYLHSVPELDSWMNSLPVTSREEIFERVINLVGR